jgi:hypothetical protein
VSESDVEELALYYIDNPMPPPHPFTARIQEVFKAKCQDWAKKHGYAVVVGGGGGKSKPNVVICDRGDKHTKKRSDKVPLDSLKRQALLANVAANSR